MSSGVRDAFASESTVAPSMDDNRLDPTTPTYAGPPPFVSSRLPRPIMSMLTCATIESRATGMCSLNHCEPSSPFSSPVCQTKSIERFGFRRDAAMFSAISSTAMEPEPSSSAPLKMLSFRAGRRRRRLSRFTRTDAPCSAVSGGKPAYAPASVQASRL